MYEYQGIKFYITERTEENLQYTNPEIYKKLKECYKQDNFLWLSYDDVITLFNPKHEYGRNINELKKVMKEKKK